MEAAVPSSVKKREIPIDEICSPSPSGVSEGNSEGLDLMEVSEGNSEGLDLMEVRVASSVGEDEDILVEILSKLPVKSILKFVCVSKQWRDIMKSFYFVKLHQKYLHRMRPNLGLLYGFTKTPWPILEFSFRGREDDGTLSGRESLQRGFDLISDGPLIVGSENGLVCLSPCHKLFVWNPATRQHRELPLPLSFEGEEVRSLPVVGFGFINNSTDYKVVRITESRRTPDHYGGEYCYRTQVFTRGQNSWREIKGCIPLGNHNFYPGRSISVNGVFYWLAKSHAYEIFALNLHDEVFHRIPLPSDPFIEGGYIRLYPWKKSIAVRSRNTYQSKTTKINVWFMTQDHSKDDDDHQWNWTKLFTITYPISSCATDLFGVWNDEFVYLRLHSTREKFICAYNPATKMERKLNETERNILTELRSNQVDNYVETVAPVF